ncbi:ATP synthase subunit B family protein [Thiomonas sp.]
MDKQTMDVGKVISGLQDSLENGMIGENQWGTHGAILDRPGGRILAIRSGLANEVFTPQQERMLAGFYLGRKKVGGQGIRSRVYAWDRMLAVESLREEAELVQKQTRSDLMKARRQLEKVRAEERADKHTAAVLQEALEQAQKMRAAAPQGPMFPPLTRKGDKTLAGIPTLMCSDLHYGEVVDGAQIGGLNTYDIGIANKRLDRMFRSTADLLLTHLSGSTYDGLVVDLGGDMVSGVIHEELQRSNEKEILACCIELSQHLARGIAQLAAEFPVVHVACVVGNHGRMERKPTAKGKVLNNFDFMTYILVAQELSKVPNAHVHISDSADYTYELYGTRYLLTHGDQFKGGSGVGGIWPSLMKGDNRKRKRSGIVGRPYDYAVMGHFHQYGIINNVIVNGSLKGYDEYAYLNNFDFQRAQQALWITHPEYGMTFQIPVYVDDPSEILQKTASSAGFALGASSR